MKNLKDLEKELGETILGEVTKAVASDLRIIELDGKVALYGSHQAGVVKHSRFDSAWFIYPKFMKEVGLVTKHIGGIPLLKLEFTDQS